MQRCGLEQIGEPGVGHTVDLLAQGQVGDLLANGQATTARQVGLQRVHLAFCRPMRSKAS